MGGIDEEVYYQVSWCFLCESEMLDGDYNGQCYVCCVIMGTSPCDSQVVNSM